MKILGQSYKKKFKDAFDNIPNIDVSYIESTNKEVFSNLLVDKLIIVSENLKGLTTVLSNHK